MHYLSRPKSPLGDSRRCQTDLPLSCRRRFHSLSIQSRAKRQIAFPTILQYGKCDFVTCDLTCKWHEAKQTFLWDVRQCGLMRLPPFPSQLPGNERVEAWKWRDGWLYIPRFVGSSLTLIWKSIPVGGALLRGTDQEVSKSRGSWSFWKLTFPFPRREKDSCCLGVEHSWRNSP